MSRVYVSCRVCHKPCEMPRWTLRLMVRFYHRDSIWIGDCCWMKEGMSQEWADTTRHERQRLQITLRQCAELLGCTVPHYSALERALAVPTDSEKSQLAWYFKRYAEVVAAEKRNAAR